MLCGAKAAPRLKKLQRMSLYDNMLNNVKVGSLCNGSFSSRLKFNEQGRACVSLLGEEGIYRSSTMLRVGVVCGGLS